MKRSLVGCSQRKMMSCDFADLIRREGRPAKTKSPMERYNGHVDDLNEYTDKR